MKVVTGKRETALVMERGGKRSSSANGRVDMPFLHG
jgi:hypothetical protein